MIREVALVGVLVAVFVFGTRAAAIRQPLARHDLDAVGYVLLVLAAVVLVGRDQRPRLTLAATLVLVGSYVLLGYPYGPVFLAVSVAVFALVDRSSTRETLSALLISLIALVGLQLPDVDAANPLGDSAVLVAESAWLLLAPAWLGAIRQRSRQKRQAWAAEQRRRVSEERLVLAREVHDVVAHNLSMVSIQAGKRGCG